LKDNGLPDNFFDIHFPILYDKKKAKEIFSKLPKIKDGYILKSIYANALRLPGEEIRDCKFKQAPPEKFVCFSSMPVVSAALYRFFEYKFPHKSKYEV
jgi:hypothetical protein